MMYIGTSLGGCLKSIMAGEVSKDDVLLIVTRTDCPDYDTFVNVVKAYYERGNPYASNPERYDLCDYEFDAVLLLAQYLWSMGKIHQPRTYGAPSGYVHSELGQSLWIEIIPPNRMNNPAVKNTWEQLKMLTTLTADHHNAGIYVR